MIELGCLISAFFFSETKVSSLLVNNSILPCLPLKLYSLFLDNYKKN